MRRVISVFACVTLCGMAIPGVAAYASSAGSETPVTDQTASGEAPVEAASFRSAELPKEIQKFLKDVERRRSALLDRAGVEQDEDSVSAFVIGGEEIDISEAPYQVFLAAGVQYFADDPESFVYAFFCGGSIIDDGGSEQESEWIVTAAHCVDPTILPYLHVASGVSSNEGLAKSDFASVSGIYMHPLFDPWLAENDIALLKLGSSIDLTPGGVPDAISLPKDTPSDWPAAKTNGFISGWGAHTTVDGVYQYPVDLQGAQVQVLAGPSTSSCGLYEPFGAFFNSETMLCAGVPLGGIDTCFGDSGGPLAIEVGEERVLAGITSWGSMECASPGFPGVYARVTTFVPWIESILLTPGTPTISEITPLSRALLVAVDSDQADGAPLTNFEYSLNDGRWVALNPPDTDGEFVIGRLRNGRQYSVRVRAVNEFGTSEPSEPVVAVPSPSLPSAATITSVTPGNRSLRIGFIPPASDGGSTIIGYEYSIDDAKTWKQIRSTKTPLLIGSLKNGVTYSVVIRARTAHGSGPASSPMLGTPQVPLRQP